MESAHISATNYSKEEVMEVKEYGDTLDENKTQVETAMIFKLNPGLKPEAKDKKNNNDDPMWSSESSALIDWLYENE